MTRGEMTAIVKDFEEDEQVDRAIARLVASDVAQTPFGIRSVFDNDRDALLSFLQRRRSVNNPLVTTLGVL